MVAQPGNTTSTTTDLESFKQPPNLLYVDKPNGFDNVVRDLGYRSGLRPIWAQRATLGALGFDLAYEIAFTDINQSAQHWQDAMPDGVVADDMLDNSIASISERDCSSAWKWEGALGFLQDSDLTTVVARPEVRRGEGFRLLPDLAFRTNIHTVLGAADVHMLLTGGDVILSKEFGVAGLFRLSPHEHVPLVCVRKQSPGCCHSMNRSR